MSRHRHSPELDSHLAHAAEAYRRRDDDAFRAELTRAVDLAPYRLDLRLNLANHHIQCGEFKEALDIWRRILDLSRRDVEAMTYMAHWTRFLGSPERAEYIRLRLVAARAERATELTRIWEIIDAWETRPIGTYESGVGAPSDDPVILVLGYKLNPDGSIHPQLADRLETAMELHSRLPASRLLLSGGVPQKGVAEATAMRKWFESKGVDPSVIWEEGHSRDVVENMLYSRQILDQQNAARVVIVTAAHNVRRAGAALEIVGWMQGSAWTVECVSSSRSHAKYIDAGADREKLYRDTLRAYGMPMMGTHPNLFAL